MALDDIVFADGDYQNFILEIPQDSLHAPLDIVYENNVLLFVIEIGDGPLYAPLDWLGNGSSANEVLFYNLTLTGGGASYFAF